MQETSCENTRQQIDVVEEIEGYGQEQNLIVVNRDGDLFYVECPCCHSTDLNSRRILSCRSCHTHFQPYYEDGCTVWNVETDSGSIGSYDCIKVLELEKNAYSKKILHGRNDNQQTLDALKQKYPNVKVITLGKDLRGGKDCHGHSIYKRFAIIPLD